MKCSYPYLLLTLLVASILGLVSCGDSTSSSAEPKTPEEMYAKADALLKPNVENDASEFDEAIVWLKKAAEAGYLKAQTDLGGLYFGGGVVKEDWDEAYRWFSMAAAQGNVAAHHFLAIILAKGTKTMKADAEAAFTHWKFAADDKIPDAMHVVGHAWVRDANHVQEGISYLAHAAEAGVGDAACELGYLYASGSELIAQDESKALHWFSRAAGLGDARALYVMGCCYQSGEGVAKDVDKALASFRLSAGQDFVPAMHALVTILSFDGATVEMMNEATAWKKRIVELEAKVKKDAKELGHDAVEAVEVAPVEPMIVP